MDGADILHTESRTADKGQSCEAGVERLTDSSLFYHRIETERERERGEVLYLTSKWLCCFLGQSFPEYLKIYITLIILKSTHGIHKCYHPVINSLQHENSTIDSEYLLNTFNNRIRELLNLYGLVMKCR